MLYTLRFKNLNDKKRHTLFIPCCLLYFLWMCVHARWMTISSLYFSRRRLISRADVYADNRRYYIRAKWETRGGCDNATRSFSENKSLGNQYNRLALLTSLRPVWNGILVGRKSDTRSLVFLQETNTESEKEWEREKAGARVIDRKMRKTRATTRQSSFRTCRSSRAQEWIPRPLIWHRVRRRDSLQGIKRETERKIRESDRYRKRIPQLVYMCLYISPARVSVCRTPNTLTYTRGEPRVCMVFCISSIYFFSICCLFHCHFFIILCTARPHKQICARS